MKFSIYGIFCATMLVMFAVSYLIGVIVCTVDGYGDLVFYPAIVNLSFFIGNFIVIPFAVLYLLFRIFKNKQHRFPHT
jgi:hypothetical protein